MAMARADRDVDQLLRAYLNLSDALHLTGQTHAARELLIEGRQEVRDLGRHAKWLAIQQAEISYDLGFWDEANELIPPELGRGTQGMTRVFYELTRASLSMGRGENADARGRLEVARDLVARSYEPQWHAPITAMLAGLERRARNIDAARAAIKTGLERLADTEAMDDGARLARIYSSAAGVEADAAQQARDLGRADDEARAIAASRRFAQQTREAAERPFASAMPEAHALMLVAEAEVAAAEGRADAERWAAAAEAWAAIDRPFRVARVRWREAEARLSAGDRSGAEAAGTDAMTIARRLGAVWLVDELAALARRGRLRLEAPGGTVAARSGEAGAPVAAPGAVGPDPGAELGLTPRERSVLALVARGRTNREIGERLFMAEKTASVHVSRILAKLDVRSRTEAAAVAHRLGLETNGDEPVAAAS
jgi:ATP/maltotriose-dependent transcriptional regulator MalT